MGEISLSELILRTENSIRPLGHSQSTLYQYQMGWRELSDYFIRQDQVLFSKCLAEQYVLEVKTKLDAGVIKEWRFKLIRRTVQMLIGCYEDGFFTWKNRKDDLSARLHQTIYVLLLKDYLACLQKEGKSNRTIELYEIIARQFLEYLEQKNIPQITQVQLKDVNLFLPFISKQYQPTCMRTVLSALRSFLRFVESKHLTKLCLSDAIPSSFGRKTSIIPTITREEERKLLLAEDCKTPLGKRNQAMMLLALRTGLRSIDIVNLKLADIHWNSNTIEIVQEKTNTPLVLPLLTEIGNAIADYILNGRPSCQQPYIFLRSQAPFQKLSGRTSGYAVSCKMMKKAGIRQNKDERKGFHCLRHSLAARLLSEETPLPVISSILGHRDKDSTKVYLSTDLEHLRGCALGLSGIEITKEELL
jgi:site-specific recombinase XerD